MTDAQVKTQLEKLREQFGDDIYTKTKWEGRQNDWLIQWFAKFVNTTSIGVPLTFTVGGNLISGHLISEADYFEQLATDFSGALHEDNRASAKEMIKSLQPQPATDKDDEIACQFVHLSNAKVFTDASKPIVSGGTLWRGKISSIEGFHLGSLAIC
ncbi:gas vesicle accessory protein GvpU [Pseudomonas sp. NFX71]|uniref:gas vesicle accessory protein GvpU n=1 Tax=Pseudomonas sp. NFX71 TaxID=3399121 RepID=UPI003A85DA19